MSDLPDLSVDGEPLGEPDEWCSPWEAEWDEDYDSDEVEAWRVVSRAYDDETPLIAAGSEHWPMPEKVALLIARAPDMDAELTRLRAINKELVEALRDAIELCEREVTSTAAKISLPPLDHKSFSGVVSRHFPHKEYDLDKMRAALSKATNQER